MPCFKASVTKEVAGLNPGSASSIFFLLFFIICLQLVGITKKCCIIWFDYYIFIAKKVFEDNLERGYCGVDGRKDFYHTLPDDLGSMFRHFGVRIKGF